MKTVFGIALLVCTGLSVLAVWTLPEHRSDVPLLYWTSDPNPARGPQIAAFEQWMRQKSAKDAAYQPVRLALDSNNLGTMKVIIQSASGAGSEIVDFANGGQLRQYVAAGVLSDVTQLAEEYGFGLDKTYAAVREEICVDGRQYGFPCNVSAFPLTINRALLEREGLPLPKFDWTWAEFLQWCLAVQKVDENGRVTRFAVWLMDPRCLWITNGGTTFNETMTRCVIDSPQVHEALTFWYDLMLKYRVMPTALDIETKAAQGGYGGTPGHWLGNELIVGLQFGRFALIQLRRFKNFSPCVALIPHKVMPMQFVSGRAAGINAGATDKRLAARFLEFLASDAYNRIIVGDADALPPNPAMAKDPEFLTPAAYPGEHGAHAKYALAAAEYGVGDEYSRFVSPLTVRNIILHNLQGVDSKALTLPEALAKMRREIDLELRHTVERDERLKPLYDRALARQRQIDRLKAEGKPVPLDMIDNPVIRRLREAGK